ncbi:hypothetical protein [Streptomyces hypolithicus]
MTKTLMSAIKTAGRAVRVDTLRAVDYLRVSTEEQAKGYGITYTGKNTRKYIASTSPKRDGSTSAPTPTMA